MSEMDDTEFLETIVRNNRNYVAAQLTEIRKEMNNKISHLERKLRAMEEENHQKEATIVRLTREIPLQVKCVVKEILQSGVRALDDDSPPPQRTTQTQQVEAADQQAPEVEPPQQKRRRTETE